MRRIILSTVLALLLMVIISVGASQRVQAAGDANVGVYDQCANDDGDGYGGNPGTCQWTNGNLNKNNSTYTEGDAVVHRLHLTGLTPGTHTLQLAWQTTKGGKHAYDYLMSWDYSEGWIPLTNLCDGITGCTGWSKATFPIPTDPNAVNQIPGNMTIFNGTITGMSAYTLSGSYAGDSETSITITFSTTGTEVFLVWGGHVATVVDWGAGNSASNISGAPYHMMLKAFDGGAIGSRDNQVMTDALVPPGELVIIKDAIPNHQRVFTYTTSTTAPTALTPDPFYLADDGDVNTTPSNTITFPGLLNGSYTITEEIAPGTSWLLTEVTCTAIKRSTNQAVTPSYSVNLLDKTLVVNLSLDQKVTCTFVNQGGGTAVQLSSFGAKSETDNYGLVLAVVIGLLVLTGGTMVMRKRSGQG